MTVLDQGSAMVGERESGKARQTDPGHGTAVLMRPQWLRVVAQGANRGGGSEGGLDG